MTVYSSTVASLVKRKLQQIEGQLFKQLHSNKGNSVLINSFPKSGTHLLYQLFENIPNLTKYNTFIVSMPSVTQIRRSDKKTVNLINLVVEGELTRAHLFYESAYDKILSEKKIIHFFIYRDPRDVVISESNYLYDMNPFNRFHYYFRKYPKLSDRIMFSILGNKFHQTPIDFPDISKRFSKYKGWLNSKNVFPIRYEDLIGVEKEKYIKEIMLFFIKHSKKKLDLDKLTLIANNSINPKKSHTFREGGTQKWKKYFTDTHKMVFKDVAGKLLVELGYEKDFNW